MTPQEALQIVNEVAAVAPVPRAVHERCVAALNVLKDAIEYHPSDVLDNGKEPEHAVQ